MEFREADVRFTTRTFGLNAGKSKVLEAWHVPSGLKVDGRNRELTRAQAVEELSRLFAAGQTGGQRDK